MGYFLGDKIKELEIGDEYSTLTGNKFVIQNI